MSRFIALANCLKIICVHLGSSAVSLLIKKSANKSSNSYLETGGCKTSAFFAISAAAKISSKTAAGIGTCSTT